MAINTQYKPKVYISDGETRRLNFDFFLFKKEHLKIKLITLEDQKTIELNYGYDYILEAKYDYYNGGWVILNDELKLTKGDKIILYRDTDQTQEINLLNLQTISPKNLTSMFDKATALIQENKDEYYRSLKYDYEELSLVNQDKPLEEYNLRNLAVDNITKTVALTLSPDTETNQWLLTTSKLDPDRTLDVLKATEAEAIEGIDDKKYITPKTANDTIKNYIATQEEAIEGINDIKYITPNTLKTTTDDKLNNYTKETIITNTIFQYKAETNYSIGQPCYALVNNEPIFYYSIKDNNINNNPTEDTEGNYWKQLKFGGDGSNLPIGSIITSTIPIVDANLHLPDGARLSKEGSHKSFYDYMNNLKETNPNIFCTEEEYEETLKINETGNCGKYVLTDDYIRLPTINGWIETTINTNANGTINQPGLPDHTHSYQMKSGIGGSNSGGDPKNLYLADYQTGLASASNPIYGRSDEVTPRGVKYLVYIVIGNELSGQEELITQANQIIADIDLKQQEQDNKIETTLNNTISKLSSYYMPDYTTAVSITGNFTAEYAGWLIGNCMTPSIVGSESAINGIVFARDYEDYQNIQLLMDKGDVFTTTAKNLELKFMKLKGETINNN